MDVRRRTVVRTAAWSVPVVGVTAAAPAFAVSPAACPPSGESPLWVRAVLTQPSDFCEGGTTFAGPFTLTVYNGFTNAGTVTITAIDRSRVDENGSYDPWTPVPGWTATSPVTAPAESTATGSGDLATAMSSDAVTENSVTYWPVVRMTYTMTGPDLPAAGCVETTEFRFGDGCA